VCRKGKELEMAQVLHRGEDVELPAPGVWKIDPAHSSVTFSTRHMMLSKVRGRFGDFDATIFVAERPQNSWFQAVIDAASIDTNHRERDEHLRSADFLQTDVFPTLSFESTQITRMGDRSLRAWGDLTIRDVTRPVSLDVEYIGVAPDPRGDRAAFVARTEIDREDWGIVWNKALDTGGLLVGKRVQIDIEVQALLASGAAAA
jgi:polyisoprenoid-binding protein YceI